jgi:hypothetical protein
MSCPPYAFIITLAQFLSSVVHNASPSSAIAKCGHRIYNFVFHFPHEKGLPIIQTTPRSAHLSSIHLVVIGMPLDGHSYLVAQGWSGKGTGLRAGAISRPLAIPQKKTLSGLGKDRDEAFPFWDQ